MEMLKYKETIPVFSILIATKNRKDDLLFTLQNISHLFDEQVECVVYDDGSEDGTYQAVAINFPQVILHRNTASKGYIFCRNSMLNTTKAKFAISLDDDAHFLSVDPLQKIKDHFDKNQRSAVIAFRLFWSKSEPKNTNTDEPSARVRGFVGCGHAWRMKAWHDIPDYPEWFEFYGEEEFASFQLFKKNWEVHYIPAVFVLHRVDMKERKLAGDFRERQRSSLRSGWYIYFLFFPVSKIPKIWLYSISMQLKKIFTGNTQQIGVLNNAMFDLLISFPKIFRERNKLNNTEFEQYKNLEATKIYWLPEE